MQSTTKFIVTPKGESHYINEKIINGHKMTVNTSIENAKDTNRIGIVVSLPLNYIGNVMVGDEVIVHHNCFRDWCDTRGRLQKSTAHIQDELFYADDQTMFLIIRNGENIAIDGYCFIKPTFEEDRFLGKIETKHIGIVKYSNAILESQGVFSGDKIAFKSDSEYEFEIDNEIYYRVRTPSIIAKILN